MHDLQICEEHIKRADFERINTTQCPYDHFKEAQSFNQLVTTKILQQQALAAANQFLELEFKASKMWDKEFKQRHTIHQKKLTKFV